MTINEELDAKIAAIRAKADADIATLEVDRQTFAQLMQTEGDKVLSFFRRIRDSL